MNRFGWILAAVAAAASIQAHPGHAPLSEGAAHFLSSPGHFLPMLLISALLLVVGQILRSRHQRAVARITAIVVATAAFAI